MSIDPALGLLRALCAGLSPSRIDVVADDTRTAFIPHATGSWWLDVS